VINVADHRPRARGVRHRTAISPRGSVHLLCWAGSCGRLLCVLLQSIRDDCIHVRLLAQCGSKQGRGLCLKLNCLPLTLDFWRVLAARLETMVIGRECTAQLTLHGLRISGLQILQRNPMKENCGRIEKILVLAGGSDLLQVLAPEPAPTSLDPYGAGEASNCHTGGKSYCSNIKNIHMRRVAQQCCWDKVSLSITDNGHGKPK